MGLVYFCLCVLADHITSVIMFSSPSMLLFTALPRNTIFICGGWMFLTVQVRGVGVLEMCSGSPIQVVTPQSWVGCCYTLQFKLQTFSLSQLNLDSDTQTALHW